MVASVKLLHLLEAFSTPWFLFSAPANHHLVFFLLEIFNNIIQYQFDGNSNLVYTIIRKRQVFHALANLPTDSYGISKCLNRRGGKIHKLSPAVTKRDERTPSKEELDENSDASDDASDDDDDDDVDTEGEQKTETRTTPEPSMEGSHPAQPAEPGTLKVTLMDTPAISQMTERESAHPAGDQPLCDLSSPTKENKEVVEETKEEKVEKVESKAKTVSIFFFV